MSEKTERWVAGSRMPHYISLLEAEAERLLEQLVDARKKHETDYRDYVGLVSQNEALRRENDELRRQLAEVKK